MPRKTISAYETEKCIFAQRLTEIMKERGENQTTLAAKITSRYVTIQRQTISLYMSGQSKPDTERLTAIARVLDVSADWLLGLSDEKALNGELRQVCTYTGLSEHAAAFLNMEAKGETAASVVAEMINEIALRAGDISDYIWKYMIFEKKSYSLGEPEIEDERQAQVHTLLSSLYPELTENARMVQIPLSDAGELYLNAAIKRIGECAEDAISECRRRWMGRCFGQEE